MEGLKNALNKLPIMLIAVLYCGYLAYDYYDWLNSSQSQLGQKKVALKNAKTELETMKKKLALGEEFFRNLDTLRSRIRQLTTQLDTTKAILSADIDIANFVRMVTLEAKKLSLSIKGIKPENDSKRDYYIEVPFKVNMRGAYVQMLVFFDRIAKLQQVIRISDFSMKPSGNNMTKYVELDGTVQLVAFKYIGTHVDEVLNNNEMKENAVDLSVDPTKVLPAKPGGPGAAKKGPGK